MSQKAKCQTWYFLWKIPFSLTTKDSSSGDSPLCHLKLGVERKKRKERTRKKNKNVKMGDCIILHRCCTVGPCAYTVRKNSAKIERRWTIIALRNLIFYFWSNIELTWHEYSFMPQITNYKEKIMENNFWTYFRTIQNWVNFVNFVIL